MTCDQTVDLRISANKIYSQRFILLHFIHVHIFFAAGTPCRFDNSLASRGTCIFPCRCTDGCDKVTGQCLDGGQCSDGHPSGYKWSGPVCQIGGCQICDVPIISVTTLVHEECVTYRK